MSDIGKNIKRYRLESGKSLSQLARDVGISKSHLHGLEAGSTENPSIWIVVALADALEIDIKLLVSRRTVTTYMRGHLCWYDVAADKHRYMDDDSVYEDKRSCPKCRKEPRTDGYDACLGKIDGAFSACCGHGTEDGYIIWDEPEDGV